MRFVLIAFLIGLLASVAAADVIDVPDIDLELFSIQDGIDFASAGDTVVIAPGRYDTVNYFNTVYGLKSAICMLPDGVTIRGVNRDDVVLDQGDAEYGVLLVDAGPTTAIKNLTIVGGGARDMGRADDGDGRGLVAGICCFENASPLIRNVSIVELASGIVVRSNSAPTVEQTLIARGSHHGVFVYGNGTTPVVLDQITSVENFDNGVYVFQGNVDITSSCVTHSGKEGIYAYASTVTVDHCNVYWNDRESAEPANYGGQLEDPGNDNGNISEEPYYCDYTGTQGYDYHVCTASPNIGAGAGGVDIGALGGGCEDCLSVVSETTWGAIKALYR